MSDTEQQGGAGPRLPSDDELAAELHAASRRTRLIGTAAFVSIVVLGIVAFVLSATFREELFTPKPDMGEIEQRSFERSNDPACRAMIQTLDERQKLWRERRLELKELLASNDAGAVLAGRELVRGYIETYELEQRRLQIAIIQDRHTTTPERKTVKTDLRADIRQYFKHTLYYLRKMDALLTERHATLTTGQADAGGLAVPGLGVVEVNKQEKGSPQEQYARAWSMLSNDHESWRVFRQGPIPCGRRDGEVPELPPPSSGDPLEDLRLERSMGPLLPYSAAGASPGGRGADAAPVGSAEGAPPSTNNAADTEGAAATDGAPATNNIEAPSGTNNAGGETNGAAGTDGGAPAATNNAGSAGGAAP